MGLSPLLQPVADPAPDRCPEARIAALAAELQRQDPALPLLGAESPAELERLSRDYYDYSPVLVALLQGCRAQLVAAASSVEQVRLVAGACARHGVPLTVRGAGTGNYGQCVPLHGGLVLDLSGLNQLRHLDDATGVIEVEAGALMGAIDQQLAPRGRALRLVPSTARSATIGGFIAGGSGGIGSLRWGFLRDAGNLLGLEVVTCEPEPRVLRLDAAASAPLNTPTAPMASSRPCACPPPRRLPGRSWWLASTAGTRPWQRPRPFPPRLCCSMPSA